MLLLELEPQFLRYEERPDGVYSVRVDTIEQANGIRFLCPKCFEANKGKVGTHLIVCWSKTRGVPDHAKPGPGRWLLHGTGYHDLTLTGDGGSDSIALTAGCMWHQFIRNGQITN
jgi:hypothetical protein